MCVQQQDIAYETVHHLSPCLSTSCVAVQLSACKALKQFAARSHTRHVLHVLEIARKLVELNEKQNPLSAAPAIECIGLICDQSSENADAVVRANGLHAMLCTLEDDCPAQVCLACIHAVCGWLSHWVPDCERVDCGHKAHVLCAGSEACHSVYLQGVAAGTCTDPQPRTTERSHDCPDSVRSAPYCT